MQPDFLKFNIFACNPIAKVTPLNDVNVTQLSI